MPEEACDWIDRMLSYTVAGGKMNRGLTTLSVCQTFAETRGHVLSTKAITLYFIFVITSSYLYCIVGALPGCCTRLVH